MLATEALPHNQTAQFDWASARPARIFAWVSHEWSNCE